MAVLSHARRGSLPLTPGWLILSSLPLSSRVIKSENTKRVTWATGVVAGCNLHRPFCFHALYGLARGEFNGPFVLRLFVAFYQKCGVIIGKWYRVKALSKVCKESKRKSPFSLHLDLELTLFLFSFSLRFHAIFFQKKKERFKQLNLLLILDVC